MIPYGFNRYFVVSYSGVGRKWFWVTVCARIKRWTFLYGVILTFSATFRGFVDIFVDIFIYIFSDIDYNYSQKIAGC